MSNYGTIVMGQHALSLTNNRLESNSKYINTIKKAAEFKKTTNLKQNIIKLNGRQSTNELINLRASGRINLYSARTVFPFTLFPATLKIDRQKLTVVHNDFLWSSHTTSIRLKDLQNVETNTGPFLGSIVLTSKQFLNNTQTINFLTRRDAIYAQRILQGFMVAHEAGINTDEINAEELVKLLLSVGDEN